MNGQVAMLRAAESHPIPEAALGSHIAFLAKTGAGKSYTVQGIAEGLLARGERVCIVDPTDRYWGLRSNPAGTGPGMKITIFGGAHGDVPLAGHHGAAIGEIIGTTNTPAILVTRQMSVKDRTRFFTDFAETLLQKNKGPLSLVIDEAHLFAPKGRVNSPQSGEMLSATNNLVGLGRGIGLRIIMVSQRPAKLHNDCLTQCETLVALRMIHPADRKAVGEWMVEWADPQEGKDLLASLPSLPTGTGWIWAPELGVLKKATFPKIKTYDSGRPPSEGDNDGPVLASIDLPAIQARLGKVAEDAKANDPKALRAKIAELERVMSQAVRQSIVPDPKAIETARAEGRAEGEKAAMSSITATMDMRDRGIAQAVGQALTALENLQTLLGQPIPRPALTYKATAPVAQRIERPAPVRKVAGSSPAGRATSGEAMPGPQRKLLTVLAQYPEGRTKKQLAILAGYSHSGGAFNNPLANLRSRGWAEGGPDRIAITQDGLDALGDYEPLPAGEALREYWFGNLPGPAAKILRALCDVYPAGMEKTDLAQVCGYEPGGGAFNNPLARLRSLELATGRGGADIRASDDLFD